jgi:MoaA/NifB/PqqE/SkfB family radical SAM enzyme
MSHDGNLNDDADPNDLGQSFPAADVTATMEFRALSRLVEDLQDGWDHPEIWPLLKDVIDAGQHQALLALLRRLHPMQQPSVGKIFDRIEAFIQSFAGSDERMLERLEAQDGLCPQIAGALFYAIHVKTPHRPPNLEGKFCATPFEKIETLVDGTVAPCCSVWTKMRLGRIDSRSAERIWNGTHAQEMRTSILDGSFRYCNKRRCAAIVANTLPDRTAVTTPHLRAIIDQNRVVLDDKPRLIHLAHDYTCNLACPSCRAELAGTGEDQQSRLEIVERNFFQPLLMHGHEMVVSLSGQGDPWASPHYRSLLRYLAEHDLNIQLLIATNGLLMTPQRWAQFSGLEKYDCRVDVSIDACTPWVYEVVRRPGRWEKLEPNLRFIAAKRRAGIFREFHLNATIQLDNFHQVGDLVEYAGDLRADSMRLYTIQNTGSHLSRDFTRKNVAHPDHPLHLAFLETLRDPRLASPAAHLYDVRSLREAALAAELASDRTEMNDAGSAMEAMDIAANDGRLTDCVALAAAARVRFGNLPRALDKEAEALAGLGFEQQAQYRRLMASNSSDVAA